MNYQHLTDNNIFTIPVGEAFEKASDDVPIIYAPLNGNMTLATRKMVEDLEKTANGENPSEEQSKLLHKFTSVGNYV